jgi:hypothetical protein
MSTIHPVHTLNANLESKRLKLVESIAAQGEPSADQIRSLADLQNALVAVREEIASHGPRLGWGAPDELK